MAALELVVTAEQDGRDVRSLLRRELGISAGLAGRLKRTETGLTLNGARVFTSAVVHAGDRLRVDLAAAERPTAIEPVPMELDIPYEDGHLLVVNKSAPLAVIPPPWRPGSRPWPTAWRTIWGPASPSTRSTGWIGGPRG